MTIIARFLLICALLAGLVYGAMWALAVFVEPDTHEIVINVPSSKFVK